MESFDGSSEMDPWEKAEQEAAERSREVWKNGRPWRDTLGAWDRPIDGRWTLIGRVFKDHWKEYTWGWRPRKVWWHLVLKLIICILLDLRYDHEKHDSLTHRVGLAAWNEHTVSTENGTDHRWTQMDVGVDDWFYRVMEHGSL